MQLSYGATGACVKEVGPSGKPLRGGAQLTPEGGRAEIAFVLWLRAVKLQSLVGNKH
jgi:hypothetical protein